MRRVKKSNILEAAVKQVRRLRGETLRDLQHSKRELACAIRLLTNRDSTDEQFADLYAQSLVSGAIALHLLRLPSANWNIAKIANLAGPILSEIVERCPTVLDEMRCDGFGTELENTPPETTDSDGDDLALGTYERLLNALHGRDRLKYGVFYTPRVLARYVITKADEVLRQQFALENGIADLASWGDMQERFPQLIPSADAQNDSPWIRILDPAAGTGVFLTEAIQLIHETLVQQWNKCGLGVEAIRQSWSRYVSLRLLPRIAAIELLMPACIVTVFRVAHVLEKTGCTGEDCGPLQIAAADTLQGPEAGQSCSNVPEAVAGVIQTARRLRYGFRPTVILGNPPFSGVSHNRSEWINRLLREPNGPNGGYYEVDGKPLGERKHWLQDDYVKFIRYGQWCIEQSNCGLLAFITNRGYLDNTSFRGMRQQLLRTFPKVSILDLHGSSKNHLNHTKRLPDGNIFPIATGVAIGLFSRPPHPDDSTTHYSELHGSRDEKLRRLGNREAFCEASISPQSPYYLLRPSRFLDCPAYDAGIRLDQAMPVFSTAAVTARDRFLVGFSRKEVLDRMQIFRDLRIPDDEIRGRFFTRGRSPKYQAGDTRSWNMADARRRAAEDPHWDQHVIECWYRPFDRRWIYWADWMIDWPRTAVMHHLKAPGNLALITRRQMLSSRPCNFFWVSDTVVIDGIIRSDNRGTEAVFPLRLRQNCTTETAPSTDSPNFAPSFISAIEFSTGCRFETRTPKKSSLGNIPKTICADDLAGYIYGLFHSENYRECYAENLRVDFPKILIPGSETLFRNISELGKQLVDLHLSCSHGNSQRTTAPNCLEPQELPTFQLTNADPHWESEQIRAANHVLISNVPREVWDYSVGSHHVCRKWLRDRAHLPHKASTFGDYREILERIDATLELSQEIDAVIAACGDWPSAFNTSAKQA
jgi:predicted helicase